MTDKSPTDVMNTRRRKLDELFADQPYLSPTMRAESLHQVSVDTPAPMIIPVVGPADGEAVSLRVVRLGGEHCHAPAPVHLRREPTEPQTARPVTSAKVPLRGTGQVRLELLLDISPSQEIVSTQVKTLEPGVMTLAEAAEFMRVAPSTVRRWVRSDGLPCAELGRRRRFRREALLEWLAAREKRG